MRHLTGIAVALLLAACTGGVPVPEPEAPEVVTVHEIAVLDATGDGTVAHLEQRSRAGSAFDQTWFATAGGLALRRFDGAELHGQFRVLADRDRAGILWTAYKAPTATEGDVRLCVARPEADGLRHCADVPTGSDADVGLELVALAGSGRGDALLLLRWGDQWRAVRMGSAGPSEPVAITLPEGVTEPTLLAGAEGLRVAWASADDVQVWALEDPGWRRLFGSRGTPVQHFVAAQQPGPGGQVWLAWCSTSGIRVVRKDGERWDDLHAPPLDCDHLAAALQLAVSDNGDAMLLWADNQGGGWGTMRYRGAGTWLGGMRGEPADLGVLEPPRLAADDTGRFAALEHREGQPLKLHTWTDTDQGWREPIELAGGTVFSAGAGIALHGGSAFVAWARPAGGDDPGTRVATARVDLAQAYSRLLVVVEGQGQVLSTPDGLACPGDCRLDVPTGSLVRLQALPAAGHRVAGFSGHCAESAPGVAEFELGIVEGTCTVRFEAQTLLALDLVVSGAGRIDASPPGPTYDPGTIVLLTATAGPGQRFVAWGGDADCADGRVTMDASRRCTAAFEPDPGLAALTLDLSGSGRVRSAPAGLDCPGGCVAYFPIGQSVVLTAEPPAGAVTTWGGACSAASGLTAAVVVTAATRCSLTFTLPAVSGWESLAGTVPGSGSLLRRPAVATDAQGVPTVAFLTQVAELVELNVLQFNGSGWQRLGSGPLNDPFVSAGQPSITLDAQGRPLVAFGDASGRIQLRRWDGSAWQRRGEGLAVTAGALGSLPQIAFDGTRVVLAFWEFGSGGQTRIALLRGDPAAGAWSGAYVDGVSITGDGELRLALDNAGMARIAYAVGSGLAGEQAPRVVQESATGWAGLCDGGAGDAPGLGYAISQMGFGLQTAADGSALLVRTRSDFSGVQAWRCAGSGAWATEGAGAGRLADVDNVLTFLQGMAMAGGRDVPTLAVMIDNGYAGTAELQVFVHAPLFGFTLVGPPLMVPQRVSSGQVAVAPGAPLAPVVAFGVEAAGGRAELQASRWRP